MSASRAVVACSWCRAAIARRRVDAVFCSRKCRQASWRLRHYSSLLVDGRRQRPPPAAAGSLRFAYADPPYPGMARRLYGRQEVNHRELLKILTGNYNGWALSTSARALREILPLCPPEARVCAWFKPGDAPPATYGLHNTWEAVVVLQGRRMQPGIPDSIYKHPARFGGDLVGRKPLVFCAWLFKAMGILPGDSFEDLFPGTGIVGRAWGELNRESVSTASSPTDKPVDQGPATRRPRPAPTRRPGPPPTEVAVAESSPTGAIPPASTTGASVAGRSTGDT